MRFRPFVYFAYFVVTLCNRGMPIFRLLVLAAFLALAPSALAHARLLKSSPAKGAEVAQAPELLELWFNELLDAGFNTVEVFSAAELTASKRTNLVKETPAVDPKDRTHLTLKLEPLGPGEYVIEWRVLSRDGHSAPGRFTFRVTGR
jgi:methionine-rich copper-binding protein CopC